MRNLIVLLVFLVGCSASIEKDIMSFGGNDSENEKSNNSNPNGNNDFIDPHETICMTRGSNISSTSSNTVVLSPDDDIKNYIENSSYSFFLLEDGVYNIDKPSGWLLINRPNITIRSLSGSRENVVIDSNYSDFTHPEWRVAMISIESDNVTISDLTIRRAFSHLIHIKGASSIKISNVRFLDSSEQFLKANLKEDKGSTCVEVSNSSFELTTSGRVNVQDEFADGCYTGGIDTHVGKNWWVHNNYFEGIYCNSKTDGSRAGLAEHAIHFWSDSEGTFVEENLIKNCARGIGFGHTNSGTIGGIIRNNIVLGKEYLGGGYWDTGISLWHSADVKVYKNIVYVDPSLEAYFGIEYRFSDTSGEITDNKSSKGINKRGEVPNVSVSGNEDCSLEEINLAVDDWIYKH